MTTTYAVVDIETTGTNPKEDRIFQFGCVFVEEGKIVGKFSTNINPNRAISSQIQHLTHTTNQEVKHAPFFEDVAETIYNLLEGTIFVAHNIHFDYRFLNSELIRCDVPPLNLNGIDTVELAQIFLPTEVSFRLSDLSESLGLTHERPHQAESDAEVTAQLLIHIFDKMTRLPIETLAELSRLGDSLSMQTGEVITSAFYEKKKHLSSVESPFEIIENLALMPKELTLFTQPLHSIKYPKTKKEKKQFLKNGFDYRKTQQSLMNQVFSHFSSEEEPKNLIIEAETGSGKTLGYLFPSSFLATPERPLIISTASILLQHQLLKRDIPKVNQLIDYPIQAVVLKSKKHYIDIQRFALTLKQPMQAKQYVLFQMMVLVWLTQTTTGDLDELNLINLDHPFFDQVHHRGVEYLNPNSPYYEADFLKFLYLQKEQSNIIIINHAFLANEAIRKHSVLPANSFLLIDEAHHLPMSLEQVATKRVESNQFIKQVMRMKTNDYFFEIINRNLMFVNLKTQLNLYLQLLDQLTETFQDLNDSLLRNNSLIAEEYIFDETKRNQFSSSQERIIQKLMQTFDDMEYIQKEIDYFFQSNAASFLESEKIEQTKVKEFFDTVKKTREIMETWFFSWTPTTIHRLLTGKQSRRLVYELIDFESVKVRYTPWYNKFSQIIYLGATVTAANDRKYLARKLGILDAKIKVMPTIFNYQEQAELFVLSEESKTFYDQTDQLITIIRMILKEYQGSILILFTSHEQLQEVYQGLHYEFLQKGREILAQGMGGSRQKLLKRFSQSRSAVLLGADSFWEGVDLPGDQLQLLVVTKIPFENPKRPYVQARYEYLKNIGQNPFKSESLPKATMKLRQGFGRLIRSTSDQGMMIILDDRMIHASYSKKIQQAFPKGLPLSKGNRNLLKDHLESFKKKINPEEDHHA